MRKKQEVIEQELLGGIAFIYVTYNSVPNSSVPADVESEAYVLNQLLIPNSSNLSHCPVEGQAWRSSRRNQHGGRRFLTGLLLVVVKHDCGTWPDRRRLHE